MLSFEVSLLFWQRMDVVNFMVPGTSILWHNSSTANVSFFYAIFGDTSACRYLRVYTIFFS